MSEDLSFDLGHQRFSERISNVLSNDENEIPVKDILLAANDREIGCRYRYQGRREKAAFNWEMNATFRALECICIHLRAFACTGVHWSAFA